MRPDDITIGEIANKHAKAHWNFHGCTEVEFDHTLKHIEAAVTEALDQLDGAELASRLARAENDQGAWFQKYLLEIAKVKDLEARMAEATKILEEYRVIAAADIAALREELVDLRYACEGFMALATKLEMERDA